MNAYQVEEENKTERRERLILEHLPQVNLLARRIHERVPGNVSLDDLISAGIIGLISAIDNYDAGQGVQIKTYAEYKIRGAILDSLRGLDWASRHRRKKAKEIEAAVASAQQRLQRAPLEEEIAAELKLTPEDYRERLVDIQGINLESLELAPETDGRLNRLSFIPDGEESSPAYILERSELEKLLAQAIAKIPEIERTILSLYYYEELTLREIGEVINMRISRISALKTQAVLRLRAEMSKHWPRPAGK